MKQKLVLLLACLVLGAGLAVAQQRVTGRVVDAQGEPVVGAAVRVEGTKIVAITDANGNYTLQNVPASAKRISVSCVGMQPITVSVDKSGNIQMTDNELNEAIVVAYGTAKKSSFTGSAAQVSGEKIEQRVTSNITNALTGQMPGVQTFNTNGAPGSLATIRIRGIGSMSSSNTPLYIVDGMPYDGDISSINPMDIESMSVLKDAAANAIYGARGANGVVLITTKKGKSRDAVVTVDAKWGSNHRAVPNYKTLGVGNYYETMYRSLYNSRYYAGYSATEAYRYADRTLLDATNGGLGYMVYDVPAGEKFIGSNFKINPNAKLGYSDGEYYYIPDNWYDEFFGKSNLRQEYNINVAGSTDRMNYYASVGYLNDNGLINNSSFRRYSGRGRIDYQAKDWLRIGTNLDFSETQNNLSNGDYSWNSSVNLFGITNMIAPIYPLYVRNANGDIIINSSTGTPLYDNGMTTNMSRPFFGNARPGAVIDNNRKTTYTSTFNGKWYAELTPIEGLKFTANISVSEMNQRTNRLNSRWGSSDEVSDGSTSVSHTRYTGVNTQYLASYTHTFDNIHHLDILAGYESYRLRMQGLSAYNDHLFNPFVGELGNAHGFSNQSTSSSTDHYMTQGVLSRLQYDYANKYFVSASYRRDASSVFHKDHRWGSFGSLGAAWLLSQEDFMRNASNWIDLLKLKASWGIQGNDAILYPDGFRRQYYAYTDQYIVTYSEETGEYAKTLAYKGNKELTWETSYAFNVGVDFELFRGHLLGSLEYFNRKTTNMLYNKPAPMSAGIESQPINVGSLVNRGIELDLTGYIFKTKDFDWSVNFNLTHYKNEIKELDPSTDINGGIKSSSKILRVGGSLYELYLKEYAGVDPETGLSLYWKDTKDAEGNVIGREKTTSYENATQYDLGDPLPKVYGGIGTTLRYKGLDFSLSLSYQLGGRVYDASYQTLMHTGETAGTGWHIDILKAWTPENRYTDVPRLNAADKLGQNPTSRWVISSDYLSFNNVTIGYTLPNTWVQKAGLGSVRVYVTGDNLGVISARKGLDPRMMIAGGNYSTQSSTSNYSAMRNITGGITLTF